MAKEEYQVKRIFMRLTHSEWEEIREFAEKRGLVSMPEATLVRALLLSLIRENKTNKK